MIRQLLCALVVCCTAYAGLGQTMLTLRQVYDFQLNDEFQYRVLNVPPNAMRYTITGKRTSANNDTVVYTRSFNNYYATVVMNPQPHLVYTFQSGIDSVMYYSLDSAIEVKGWPVDSCASFSDTLYNSATYCGVDVYEWTGSIGMCFEGQTTNEIFGRGIGRAWHRFYYPAQFVDDQLELFYYKKDSLGIICGAPDSTTMSVKQAVVKGLQFSVYPNPVATRLTIATDGLSKPAHFSIIDVTGKEVLNRSAERERTVIDLSAYPEGIYFLKFVHGADVLYKKLVVQR